MFGKMTNELNFQVKVISVHLESSSASGGNLADYWNNGFKDRKDDMHIGNILNS